MKSYPKYKPSKIVWYPEIPENWDYCKVKHVANTYAGGTPSTVVDSFWHNGEIPWLPSGKLQNCEITSAEKFITQDGLNGSSTKWIKPNTVLLALTGATCANIGYLTFPACANQSVIAIDENTDKANSRFLYFMFLNMRSQILTHQTGGAQAGINDSDVKNLYLLKPSLEEQSQIAEFLDYKTNLIDATIEKKKRLIELLKEKRQAVINEAVTKGLNPNAKMKDSGVEWLGVIPEHWNVKKLKLHLEFLNNIRVPIDSSERFDRQGEYPYYGASGIIDYVDDYLFDGKYILIGEDGANILSRSTPLAFIAEGKFWVNNHAHILGVPVGVLEYFCYQLELIDYTPIASGSAQPKLTKDAIANIKIFIPPVKEQTEICKHINDITKRIDFISSNIEKVIEKLQAYRQSLISEAVTGKIDVREWHNPKNN